MAIISIVVDDPNGVDINASINNATPGFSPNPFTGTGNAGIFTAGGTQYDQYGIAAPSGTNSDVLALGDFTYVTGTLSGVLDTLSFGENLTTDTGGGRVPVPSPYAGFDGDDLLLDSAFTISNIGLEGYGANNVLNNTLFDLLRGGTTGGSPAAFNTWLFGTAGNSIDFLGNAGDDAITASAYNDVLRGEGGNDTLNGGAGDDIILGGSGNDVLNGQDGNDTIDGGTGDDAIVGGNGNDTISGGAGNDTIGGGTAADILNGGAGNDTINGDGGNDTLNGGSGNDILNGGAGVDILTGGIGNDTFVFSSVANSPVGSPDTITDFDAGGSGTGAVDLINLVALGLSNGFTGAVASAYAAWYDSGTGTLYASNNNDTTADFAVTLTTLTGTLDASDFIFV